MKDYKHIIFVGFIVLFLVGLSALSFSEDAKNAADGKFIKITGIDPKYTDIRTFNFWNTNNRQSYVDFVNIGSYDGLDIRYHEKFNFNNGILISPIMNGSSGIWKGSGSYFVYLEVTANDGYIYCYFSKRKISFEKNITEIPFADFNFIERVMPQQ